MEPNNGTKKKLAVLESTSHIEVIDYSKYYSTQVDLYKEPTKIKQQLTAHDVKDKPFYLIVKSTRDIFIYVY